MKIVPISVPTPFYVGPVNVYLIREEPLTLVDTGPKTKEALEALREGLRKERLRVSDIRRILLTHAHEDHCGLAKKLRDEAKDAEVFVHGWETGHRAGRLEYDEHRALLERAGVPVSPVHDLRQALDHPLTAERRLVVPPTEGDGEGLPRVRLPIEAIRSPRPGPAPRLGEHSREVLEAAGFSGGEIAALGVSGATSD